MSKRRQRNYLFLRPGSQYWRIRLQMYGKSVERSLGTTDRRQAEIIALPMVAEHKARLLAGRPRLEPAWVPQYPPGLHVGPDGGRLFATERELHHLDADGAVIRTEPNGGLGQSIVNLPIGAVIHFGNPTRPVRELRRIGPVFDVSKMDRPPLPTKNGHDSVLEVYLQHRNLAPRFEYEARRTWEMFRSLVDKPLKDCDRDDGRKLVAHYEARGLKSASIQKKVNWLNAAVNFAIKENRLRFNPFSAIVPQRSDAMRRLPLTEDDMRTIRGGLAELTTEDQLLLRLLATSGMRLGEAISIYCEATESGCRYVTVGTKTEQSLRRVPLPGGVLAHLPEAIKGRLFHGNAKAASKRLNDFLRDVGITDPAKTVHSLRHRAADRLRAEGAPVDIRHALLGHEVKSVAEGYGAGHPVVLLKRWIDRIGF